MAALCFSHCEYSVLYGAWLASLHSISHVAYCAVALHWPMRAPVDMPAACESTHAPNGVHLSYNIQHRAVRCGAMRHCGAGYAQSLAVLATAKRASNDSLLTKSSIMLGVGESGTVAVLRVLAATSTDCDHIATAVVYVVLRRVSPVDGHSSQRIVYRCTHV